MPLGVVFFIILLRKSVSTACATSPIAVPERAKKYSDNGHFLSLTNNVYDTPIIIE